MENSKREHYLRTRWHSYAPSPVGVLTAAEILDQFAQATAGKTPKSMQFKIGGKLSHVLRTPMGDGIDQITIRVEDLEFLCRTELLRKDEVSNELLNEVLRVGDWVILDCAWTHVQTSGLFPKIETISPHRIHLAAPDLLPQDELGSDLRVNQKRIKQWSLFLALVRRCFEYLQFTEVRTPTLVDCPGLEPFLDAFSTEFEMGKTRREYFLPTSPEFHMKRLLSGGMSRIFQFKESFRNGEVGPHHQPEFMMLEWYRSFDSLDSILKDVKGLINYLKLHWPEPIKGHGPMEIKTMAQIFAELLEFDLTTATTREELLALAQEAGVSTDPSDSWDEVFHRIFLQKIEPHLGRTGPTVVRDFPPSQSAWARLTKEGWADRAEVYWRGVELANGYNELNDPVEQRARFEKAITQRKSLGRRSYPPDENFLKALDGGLPPSAGMALGLDRLFMLIIDAEDLQETRPFAVALDPK